MEFAGNNGVLLTKEQRAKLQQSVRDFLTWLLGKLDPIPSRKYESFLFVDPDAGDWFMDVPGDGSSVKFNTNALRSCTFEYYRMIVLHECFHLLTQDVPNKLDAKRLKDDFGETMMILLDIEADFYTYLFHREVFNYSFVDFLRASFEGIKTFADRSIRFPKFERFIGTQLSIFNHYIFGRGRDRDIYLASIKNVATEETVHLLISKATHFQYAEAKLDQADLKRIRLSYSSEEGLSVYEYAIGIAQFCSKALGIVVPPAVEAELQTLNKLPIPGNDGDRAK